MVRGHVLAAPYSPARPFLRGAAPKGSAGSLPSGSMTVAHRYKLPVEM